MKSVHFLTDPMHTEWDNSMAHVQVGLQVRPLSQHDFQTQHGHLEKNDNLGNFQEVQSISHEHWAYRYS